jgi:hypothetical protein
LTPKSLGVRLVIVVAYDYTPDHEVNSMQLKKLPLPPKPAKRGTKTGWVVVGGEVPPETADLFARIAVQRGVSRSELAGQIISRFVESVDRAAA